MHRPIHLTLKAIIAELKIAQQKSEAVKQELVDQLSTEEYNTMIKAMVIALTDKVLNQPPLH